MENISLEQESGASTLFEKISYYALIVFVFLLPFFVIPPINSLIESKGLFISFLVLVPLIITLIGYIKKGEATVYKGLLWKSALLVPVIMAISALVNHHLTLSFFGKNFETGTVAFVAIMIALLGLVRRTVNTEDKIMRVYSIFWISSIILLLWQLLRLFFGPSFLPFGLLTTVTSNLVGKWTELGIIFGAVAILSLAILEFLPARKAVKSLLVAALVLIVFFLFIINFATLWWAVALGSLILGLYKFFVKENHEGEMKRHFPVASLIVFVIALILALPIPRGDTPQTVGTLLSEKAVTYFNASQIEIRPSFSSTLGIAKQTYKTGVMPALFGVGPNRFINQYLQFKPNGVNLTPFWNYDFDSGIGYIPTFMTTVGILGTLAWVLFLVLFLYKGVKTLLIKKETHIQKFLTLSSFVTAVYLWFMAIAYVPSAVTISLTFVFTGIALVVFSMERGIMPTVIRPRDKGIVAYILFLIVTIALIILSLFTLYKYVSIVVADNYFRSGVSILNTTGKFDDAEALILKAVAWNKNDTYYLLLAEINIAKMSQLASSANLSEQANADLVKKYISNAGTYANEAILFDNQNYQNWIEAGRVFESVVPLQVKDSFNQAVIAYGNAVKYNPQNPALYLMLARLDVANKNPTEAKQYIAAALQLKSNYAEAAFLLSQIQVQEGNLTDAINSVQAAAQFSPSDQTIYFELGLLKYNNKDYSGAVEALTAAITLDPQYSNARYFLGLSLSKLGKVADAINQFTIVQQYNPDNQEVALILKNLKAGKQPFTDAQAPIDNKPEKRATLPVKDDIKTTKKSASTI